MANRSEILHALSLAFEKQDYALAFWQGGSAAFNRLDEWSDLDTVLIVQDGLEHQAMQLAEKVLEADFGIEEKFEIDPPHWPGMVQTFFKLKNTSPYLLIDFSVLGLSAEDKFAAPEIHGTAQVVFDKKQVLQNIPLINVTELKQKLKTRISKHKKRIAFFSTLVDKEINRGKPMDAFAFYWAYSLNPLIEILRIKHSPYHWNFGMRYLQEDLPKDISAKLQPLFFINNLSDLDQKNQLCREWFDSACKEAEESLAH